MLWYNRKVGNKKSILQVCLKQSLLQSVLITNLSN